MTETLTKISVRYWGRKEWSGTDGDYDEISMPSIKTLIDLEGKGKIVKVQCYRQFSGSYYRVAQKKRPIVFQGLITALVIDIFARNFQR